MIRTVSHVSLAIALVLGTELAAGQSTSLVSVNSAGVQGSATSGAPALSAGARFVAFQSLSANLVRGDTNGMGDVFVHDRATGATQCVSVDPSGVPAAGSEPSVSADGRFVTFASGASTLVPGDTNGTGDIFVRDRLNGHTTCVSVDPSGVPSGGLFGRISVDGRFVSFASGASSLVPGDTNGVNDVFVRDLAAGHTTRVSVDSSGNGGNGSSYLSALSADGRWVVFASYASNLVPADTNGMEEVFVHDRTTGQTTRVSVDSAGLQANGNSFSPSISAAGRHVAFASNATNLVPSDTNNWSDVFVRDLETGQTTRVNVSSSGGQSNQYSDDTALSADGRLVAFMSSATNLVAADTNGTRDVFVHDRLTGATSRASVDTSGGQANNRSYGPEFSADGRWVVFESDASNLVGNDTNMSSDIFLCDRGPLGFTPFCLGDGSGFPCPCGNAGAAGHGCENSQGMGGALLAGSGVACVSADSLVLVGSFVPPAATGLFFQGTLQIGGGSGAPFGDGLRCAGGSVSRIGTRTSDAAGHVAWGAPLGDIAVSVRGLVPAYGGPRHYQLWYRNAAPFCTPDTFNLSNGLSVVWLP